MNEPRQLLKFYNDGADAELYLYGTIGSDFWGDGITDIMVRDQLKEAKKAKTLAIRINSGGGDVFQGNTIANLIGEHAAAKTVYIDGLAASIASVIAMSGDTVKMADNAMMMVHDPWAMSMGSAEEMRKTADLLDQIKELIVNTYAAKTKQERNVLAKLMADETWMDPTQAKDMGFADEITHNGKKVAAYLDPAKFKFKFIPQQFTKPPSKEEQWAEARAEIAALKLRA